jgi:hypothetical protein
MVFAALEDTDLRQTGELDPRGVDEVIAQHQPQGRTVSDGRLERTRVGTAGWIAQVDDYQITPVDLFRAWRSAPEPNACEARDGEIQSGAKPSTTPREQMQAREVIHVLKS